MEQLGGTAYLLDRQGTPVHRIARPRSAAKRASARGVSTTPKRRGPVCYDGPSIEEPGTWWPGRTGWPDMPQVFRVYLDLEGDGLPAPEHMRGFASTLFEKGIDADHHGQIKPYTVGRFVPLGRRIWALDLTVTVDSLAPVVHDRLVPGHTVFLGPLSGVVSAPPVTISARPWADLAAAPPITGVELSFDTPVVFRHQGGQHAAPTPSLVFGHLRRRWRNLDPGTAPDVSFQEIEFGIDLSGTRVMARGAGSSDAGTGRTAAIQVAAFAGTAAIDVIEATMPERIALGALAGAAPFLGMGAWTTAGFGAVSLLAFWVDD